MLAIVALSANSQPEDLDGYDEVWTINECHQRYGWKPTLIIALDDLERDQEMHPEYVDCIVNAGVPVLSTEAKEQWPNVEAYPLKEVCDWLREHAYPLPEKLLDNTCNYAFALALTREYKKIGLFGFDWCNRDSDVNIECARVRWEHKGYGEAPDWFKYYEDLIVQARRSGEPGIEAFHFLLGMACSHGIEIHLMDSTTVLNMDRDNFFYGYQEQPNVT